MEEKEILESMRKAAEERRIKCLMELQQVQTAVLQKYHCQLDFSINIHQDGRIQPILNVIPMVLPEDQKNFVPNIPEDTYKVEFEKNDEN